MTLSRKFAHTALIALITLSTRAQASPDANAAVERMHAAVAAAKTYQATMMINVTMGKMGSMAMSVNIEMLPPSGKLHLKVAPSGQATGQMQIGVLMASMEMVDDGKNTYIYRPSQGAYQKGKHTVKKRDPSQFAMAGMAGAKFKYVRDDVLNGVPVMVAESPRPAGQGGKVVMYIDKKSGRMKQLTLTGTQTGPDGKPMPMNMTMVVKREVLNAPIPNSAFVFTPPAGAKEVQGGGGGGGIPGLGGMGGG